MEDPKSVAHKPLEGIPANAQWTYLLFKLLNTRAEVSPRGQRTKELINVRTAIDMRRCVVTNRQRRLGYRFLPGEAWWILSGDNRVETIQPYSKQIANFSDDGRTFYGAYGPWVVNQLPYCIKAIEKDPATRQAVLTIWQQSPPQSKDIPCTIALQFMLRQWDATTYIVCNATMRSSDAWLGWPYDVHNFSMISAYVAAALNGNKKFLKKYRIRCINLGTLFLTAGSQHLYERNWDKAADALNAVHDVAFDYAPFDEREWFGRQAELVDHLKAVADRNEKGLKGKWLRELLHM